MARRGYKKRKKIVNQKPKQAIQEWLAILDHYLNQLQKAEYEHKSGDDT